MNYLSVCSGIEAASVAWHPLGWLPVAFAEIEKFPSAVLAHHYPHVPNLGDMTKFKDWPDAAPDVLVGGTPCQSFSVAGLRKGMADPRGNLALTYLAIADCYRPEWLLWENVPGVLSSNGGRDFGAILGGMVELGYGVSYRVLDAQYVRVDGFGRAVPQRRRRVFVVGNSRDWRRAAAVLFERESLSWNSAPRRETGERVAPTISARPTGGGGLGTDCDGGLIAFGGNNTSGPVEVSTALQAHAGPKGRMDFASEIFLTEPVPIDMRQASRGAKMTNNRFDGSSGGAPGTGIGEPGDPSPTIASSHVPAIAFDCKASGQSGFGIGDIASTLRAMGHADSHTNGGGHQAAAFAQNQAGDVLTGDVMHSLHTNSNATGRSAPNVMTPSWAVRRLTPTECERLQGFPDGYTDVPWRGKETSPDGPRYKALGNSMAVNAMRWIGRRIQMVSEIPAFQEAAE